MRRRSLLGGIGIAALGATAGCTTRLPRSESIGRPAGGSKWGDDVDRVVVTTGDPSARMAIATDPVRATFPSTTVAFRLENTTDRVAEVAPEDWRFHRRTEDEWTVVNAGWAVAPSTISPGDAIEWSIEVGFGSMDEDASAASTDEQYAVGDVEGTGLHAMSLDVSFPFTTVRFVSLFEVVA